MRRGGRTWTAPRGCPSVGATSISSGSAGPPRPMATTTTSRSRESSRASWPVRAVLPIRLPVPIDAQRRKRERLVARRLEVEVRPEVAQAERERARRKLQAPLRRQHRLVGEVHHEGGLVCESGFEIVHQRHAVLLSAAELLHTSHPHGGDEVVRQLRQRGAYDVGVVLPVDDRDRSHEAPTSSSISSVDFSYSSVSVEKRIISSSPWYG